MKCKYFTLVGPIRNDLNGLPYGFLFLWKPHDDVAKQPQLRFPYVKTSFSLGVYWYPSYHWFPKFEVNLNEHRETTST